VVVRVDKVTGGDGHVVHGDGGSVFHYMNPTVGRSDRSGESAEAFGPHLCISDRSIGNCAHRTQTFVDVAIDFAPMGAKTYGVVYVFDNCHRWAWRFRDVLEVSDAHS